MRKIMVCKLANWISTPVIADLIVSDLKRREIPATLKNAKGLWLAALESLPDMLNYVPTTRILKEADAL